MITAKDIQRKKFEKVKFGYSPEEVDAFLSQIEDDLRVMQQELDDSEEKIQLLADKVREYKENEEDIKNALLGAQKQAREVIKAANEAAMQIKADAQSAVDTVKSQALLSQEAQLAAVEAQLAADRQALAEGKKQIAEFKHSLFAMYKDHLELISMLPDEEDEAEDAEETTESAEIAETINSTETAPEAEPKETAVDAAEQIAAFAETIEAEIVEEDPFQAVVDNSTFESRRR